MVKITKNPMNENVLKVELTITVGKLYAILHALDDYRNHSAVGNDLYHEINHASIKVLDVPHQ